MEHRIRLTALLLLMPLIAFAQRITLTGTVTDATDGGPLPGTSVVLLNAKDSTQVTGISTDDNGKFRMTSVKAGKYLMRLTFVGYLTQWKNVTLEKGKKEVNLGTIALKENASLLKEAEVVTSVAQVEMKADTFVYNADTYKLPEGSALEELVKKLPGAEVSDDGTIKINGKTVSKVMVEGKEFFENDTKMAMKNLPTKMVKKIKAYDKKSDYTRITGIDDGEEETVLDLTVKKEMKEGWMINADLGYGTEDRYTGKANINRFLDHSQFSVILSRNNVNDNGFGWGGPRWGRSGGITTSTMAGANFWWDNGKPDYTAGLFKVGGNIRYSHSKSNSLSKTNSETFLDNVHSTFSNQMNQSLSRSANVNIGIRLEWMPDSMTNIFFR
ncbi:MAG: carboxypeptidase-like regulatory domain-containing protein, partial [Bacteroidaceae bacterium]